MRIILGKGDVLITEAGNDELRNITFEITKGSGIVGEPATDLGRVPGAEVTEEDFEDAACTLTFNNATSLAVVLEKVLQSMKAFRGVGMVCEHAETWESIEALWLEVSRRT